MLARRGATPAAPSSHNVSYERFNCSKSHVPYRSWNYRAAGTRLSLRRILGEGFGLLSFQAPDRGSGCPEAAPALLGPVTTSLCQDGVICATAACRNSGGRLPGPLSVISPR